MPNTAGFSPGCLPPDFLNLSGLYAATPDQSTSLENLESQAVTNVIAAHGLSLTDQNAVLAWGRADAEADLFTLLEEAINDCSSGSCTTDEQNAADWFQAVEDRQAVAAAQDAGYEYVKWSGQSEKAYQYLLSTNPSQSALQTFLSTNPSPYSPITTQADSGYCAYQAPAPDTSDYADPASDPTCNGQPPPLGYVAPTPTYAQFTQWGEDDANYSLLSSGDYLSAADADATGAVFGP